jgi:hypothetical protein
MKKVVVLIISVAAFSFAQDKPAETVKRLDSVTWDLNTHKLVWVVQTGAQVNGKFVPQSSKRYEVSPDEASMIAEDEKRAVDRDEADSLHHLLDVLSLYCAQSTMEWDKGGLQKKTTSAPSPDGTPVKVDQKQPPAKKPTYHVAATDNVARAH